MCLERKVKLTLYMSWRHTGEWRCSCVDVLTYVLNRGAWIVPWTDHFTPHKCLQYPFYWKLCGSHSCCVYSGERKNLLPLPRIKLEFLGNAAHILSIKLFLILCLEILVTFWIENIPCFKTMWQYMQWLVHIMYPGMDFIWV